VTELYPAALSFVEQGVASEREVCQFLGIARTAFQRWKGFHLSPRKLDDQKLEPLVTKLFHHHKSRYGTRRLRAELSDLGQPVGRRRVGRLLRNAGLSAIQPRSFKPRTTDSRHRLGYSPNLILELKEIAAPNHLWVGDISYLPVRGMPFAYLAVLMDRCSRKIIAWQIRADMTEGLVIPALRHAIKSRKPAEGLIHHTDRGGQYAATTYRQILLRAGIQQSMSRANECYDNAFMESCFGTIKTELQMTEYPNYQDAEKEIATYVNYYNFQRKHSALGYQTPNEFEIAFFKKS
jgi:putative transposase